MKAIVFIIILLGNAFIGSAQLERGNLIADEIPIEVLAFFKNDTLILSKVRATTNFLTNLDLYTYKNLRVPKRKKAFLRHIKHLSEKLEYDYFAGNAINKNTYEYVFELLLFEHALQQETLNQNGTNFWAKARMIFQSKKSKRYLKFELPDNENVVIVDPQNSPYWRNLPESIALHKRFSYLAKLKKVKATKTKVIIFDELSYSGSAPKIKTLDLDLDNEWTLKWGDEVHTDVVASRIFAALGFDVDHPYFYEGEHLTLIFDPTKNVKTAEQLMDSIQAIYKMDLEPFVSSFGKVTAKMVVQNPDLALFEGLNFVQFIKCAIEARPDRVKRIGPFGINEFNNAKRKELRGALLAHAFIDNWDTREQNTLLTTVHDGDYKYSMSAVFSDLGTSLGVSYSAINRDFKVGLVNELDWEVAALKNKQLIIAHELNEWSLPYKNCTYADLKWMATKIAAIDSTSLSKMVLKAGWPEAIANLYFHKLASRRASILRAFKLQDQNPIPFDRNYTYIKKGVSIIENGVLKVEYNRNKHPEGFLKKKGRFRNYGN